MNLIDDIAVKVCFDTYSCDASDTEAWKEYRPMARELISMVIGREVDKSVTDEVLLGLVEFLQEAIASALGEKDDPTIQ